MYYSVVYFVTPIIIGYYIMEYTTAQAKHNVHISKNSINNNQELKARSNQFQSMLDNVQKQHNIDKSNSNGSNNKKV